MKCSDTHVSNKLIATPFRITWPSEDHWGDVSYQCEAYWTNLVSHTMKCSVTHVSMYTIISEKRLTWDSHTLQNHVTLRRPLRWCLIPMWSLLDKPCVTYNEMYHRLYWDIYECAEWYVYTIIRSRDKLLTEDSHTLPNHITLRRPLWWGLRPMWVHTTSYSLVLTPERRVHNVFGFRH